MGNMFRNLFFIAIILPSFASRRLPAQNLCPDATRVGIYANHFGDPSNPALIFLHGGPGHDSLDFESTTGPWLASQGYYVVSYDQRGQGRSALGDPTEYSYKQYAADLYALIQAARITKPMLLAHSHGGPIALAFLDQFADRVGKVLLISSPLEFSSVASAIYSLCKKANMLSDPRFGSVKDLVDFAKSNFNEKDYDSTAKISALFMFAIKCGAYNGHLSVLGKQMSEMMSQVKPIPFDPNKQALYGFMYYENYFRKSWFASVAKHSSQLWGVYGGRDGLFTDRDRTKIKNALKENHYFVLPSASHSLYRQQPEEFLRILRSIEKLN